MTPRKARQLPLPLPESIYVATEQQTTGYGGFTETLVLGVSNSYEKAQNRADAAALEAGWGLKWVEVSPFLEGDAMEQVWQGSNGKADRTWYVAKYSLIL